MTENSFKYGYNPGAALDSLNRIKAEAQYKKDLAEQQRQQAEQARVARVYQKDQETLAHEQAKVQEEKSNPGFWDKLGQSGLDLVGNLFGGVAGLVEGVVDAGAGILGGVGGIFGADTDWAEDFIKKDYTGDLIYKPLDEATQDSWLGGTVRDVVRGVGQMLPTIAVVAAAPFTGGGSLAALPYTIGASIASSGGQGMQEALNDGSDFGGAFGYGVTQAALEAGTEALTGGFGRMGALAGKTALKGVGKTVAKEALSEAFEEGSQALVNPIAKAITYKGGEAFQEYSNPEFYKGVAQNALVGGLSGGLTAGAMTTIRSRQAGGLNSFYAEEQARTINESKVLGDEFQSKNKLTEKNVAKLTEQQQKTAKSLSERLQKMDGEKRSALIQENNLSYLFNEDGSVKTAAKTTYNPDSHSFSLRGREDSFKYNPISEAPTEVQRRVMQNVEKIAGGRLKTVIAEDVRLEDGTKANAAYRDGILYIDKNANAPQVEAIHEITHSLEGTKSYADFADFVVEEIRKSPALTKRYGDLLQKYLKTEEAYSSQMKSMDSLEAEYVVRTELVSQYAADMFGNEEFVHRLAKSRPNVAQRLWQWIKDKIKVLTAKGGDKETISFLLKAEKMYRKALMNSFTTNIESTLQTDEVQPVSSKSKEIRASLQESVKTLQKYTDQEMESIEKTKTYKVARNYEEIVEFIKNAKVSSVNQYLFIGKISESYAQQIENATGVDVRGKSIALNSDDIVHVFKQHGNQKTETPRGQIAVTMDNIENIIDTILAPDKILKKIGSNNVLGIVFQKQTNGIITAVTVLSEKKRALTLKSAWINQMKKEQSISPSSDAEAPHTTSKTLGSMKTVLNNQSIAQDSASVNSVRKNTGKDSKTRYSLAGETALATDKAKLSEAKQMLSHGVTERYIYEKTGWLKGVDGKWRIEIDDSKMKVYHGKIEALKLDTEGVNFEEASFGSTKLSKIVEHDALFTAYPELNDLTVEFVSKRDGTGGEFVDGRGKPDRIIIHTEELGADTKKVLLHEIQHWIQKKEGFAKGASIDYWQNVLTRRATLVAKTLPAYQNSTNDVAREKFVKTFVEREATKKAAYEKYRNTAGEQEARDVADRSDMTEVERKTSHPFSGNEETVLVKGDIKLSLAKDEDGEYNGKKNGEIESGRGQGKVDEFGVFSHRGSAFGTTGERVRRVDSLQERFGREAGKRISTHVDEVVEHSKGLDKYTESLSREHAKKIGYQFYFSKLLDKNRDVYRDGKTLFVSENATADTIGRALDKLDPVNRKTEPGKTAHISTARWKKFLDLHGDGDVFVAKIPIQDFLDLTADRLAQRDIRAQTAPLDVSDLKSSDQLYLRIDFKNNVVLDHEGRHRLTALLADGYQNADVMILAENVDQVQYDKLVVRPQESAGEKPVALFNLISATDSTLKDYAAFQYLKTRDNNVRYSLPVSKETKHETKVLTEIPQEKKSLLEKGNDLWTNVQIHVSDEQAGVVKAGKRLGISDMDVKTHYARSAYNAAGSMLDDLQFDRSGKRVGEGFKSIWDPIYEKGDAYRLEFYEYLMQFQNIDRLARGKELLANTSEGDSKKAIDKANQLHPEFKTQAEKVWKFNDNLLQLRVDMGLVSQGLADRMREMYPHYVPTFREMAGSSGIGGLSGKYNLAVKTTIKTAKGSTLDILPPDVVIARQTMEVMRAGRVNELIAALYDGAVAKNDFKDVSVIERQKLGKDSKKLSPKAAEELYDLLSKDHSVNENKNNQVTFYKDGERITLAVTPEVFAGIDSYSPNVEYRNKLIEALTTVNSVFKKLVTSANPFFLVRNFFRDLQEALFYSKHGPVKFTAAMAKAYKQIATNGEIWQRYKALGGLSSSLFDYDTGIKRSSGIKAKVEGAINKLEWANMIIEQAPRLAEFTLSLQKGATAEQALLDSAEVTTNFSRGGKTAKMLNRTVMPFLNPSIQGWSKLVRTVFGKKDARAWIALIVKALILGVGLSALNDLLNGDDEDYEALSMRDKENYYLFKVGDTFLKLPKGRVLSVFGSLYLRAKEFGQGNKNAWDGYLSSVASQVSPVDNMTRTIFSPFSDAATNTTWYGGEIEGRKFDNVAPKDRYDESTSSIAIWLGKILNYSPKKIHYVIDQYSGIIGDIILPATTKKEERNIFASNFAIDPALNSRWSNDFYTALDEANYAKSAGDVSAAYVVKYLNSIAGEVSDMYAQKQQIEASDKSAGDKATESKAVQLLINETQKKAVEGIQSLQNTLAKMKPEEAISRLAKSSEYRKMGTLGQGKSEQRLNEYYYAVALNKAFEIKLDKKYQLYSLFDDSLFAYLTVISTYESDKDKDGKVISGSRKKKVFDYINKLQVSSAQKYILMGLAGYKSEKGQEQVSSLIRSKVKDKAMLEELLEASGY